jgi:hypothetical protein
MTNRERERIERQAKAKHDQDTERLGGPDLDPELADWIDHKIAEGQQIIRRCEHSDPVRCAAAKATIFLLEEARSGDSRSIRLARGLARRESR